MPTSKKTVVDRGTARKARRVLAFAERRARAGADWVDLSNETDQWGMRRAYVNLVATANDGDLWKAMDNVAFDLAMNLAQKPDNKTEPATQQPAATQPDNDNAAVPAAHGSRRARSPD